MSHTRHEPAVTRLQRSELAVPGSNPGMFEKALAGNADYVFLDLEDAVAPSDKETARRNVIEALNDLDWRGAGKTVSVRVNGIDTHYFYRDVVEVLEQAGGRLDTVLIPKAGVAADIYMTDALVTQISAARDLPHRIGIEALIETALGMANVEAIATASPRLEALHFGVADLAASLRARTVNIGGLNPDYPGDQWHAGLTRLATACRAYGLRPIDGPFGDFNDADGFLDAVVEILHPDRGAVHAACGQRVQPGFVDLVRIDLDRELRTFGKAGHIAHRADQVGHHLRRQQRGRAPAPMQPRQRDALGQVPRQQRQFLLEHLDIGGDRRGRRGALRAAGAEPAQPAAKWDMQI